MLDGTGKTEISSVPAEYLGAIWPHVAGYFQSFEERSGGEISVSDLVSQIAKDRRQCWIAMVEGEVKACALTRVEANEYKTVQLDFCAGEGRGAWRDDVVNYITEWAIAQGSRRLRVVCRPGWTRELKAMGLKETHRILEKEL